ncbi:Ig-like domain-containing protein [uncultured Pseudoalteromonas sp.]|uniref:Ig-like domain-containing protein n=1 Tax=uncultured Pseudoalteromonas sp. TaxID=114053 RepID=UPI002599899F|nr:Ig-like domain-containing protein [uncultured Pseudoalteromonas sp.]
MRIKFLTVVLLSCISSVSHAELIEIEFTDTLNKTKKIKPSNGDYINPTSPIKFVLAGGLDRKFSVQLTDASNNSVEKITTDVITINDRINAAGKEFYGKQVTLKFKPLQTSYTAKINLLDLSGDIVETETLSFIVDTTPPVITGNMTFLNHSNGNGSIEKFDYLSAREFRLNGISDSASGLDKAFFTAQLLGSNEEREAPVSLDPVSGQASWLKPSDGVSRKLFYQNRSDYTIGFRVLDKAGNEARKSRVSGWNGVCGARSVSHVWNPIATKWDEFTPGMNVHENPYKFRVQVDKSEHVATNGTGRFGYNWKPSHTDASNVYIDFTAYVPVTRTYYNLYSDTGNCGAVHQTLAPVTLASGVDESPQLAGFLYRVKGESEWINSDHIKRNKPYTVENVKINVQPRSYEQKATLSGLGGQCIIAARASECVMNISYTRNTGSGYAPYSLHIASTDGRFNGHYTYLYSYWDFQAPVAIDIQQENEFLAFTVFDADAVNDWRRANWLPRVMDALATNNATGQVIKLPLVENSEPNYQKWWRKHSLTNLPEGNYKLSIHLVDTYNNERTEVVTQSFERDATPPQVRFKVDGSPLGDTLRGLENLRINLSDKNPSQITQIQLLGGPTNDDVFLAWTKVGVDEYRPEYPRIYPEPNLEGGYELKVTVRDSHGNEATHKAKFAYYPANLIEIGKKATLPLNAPLKLRNDQYIGVVQSNVLRTDSGAIATGLQDVFFTLRSDAVFPVYFEGQLIMPGQTKKLQINLGEEGLISSPVYPAETKEGQVYYMLDIPQLRSKFD